MNDLQLRSELKKTVLARYASNPDTLVVEELGLMHGAARIDLALVNGIIHGFEIKSNKDTLKRLPNQAQVYNAVLDRVTLVVGMRHADDAIQLVPGWWGIKLALAGKSKRISFQDLRRPKNNPSVDMQAVVKLLWREEALSLLEEIHQAHGIRSKSKSEIYERLVCVADSTWLRAKVRLHLRDRTAWISDPQQLLNDG